MIKIETFTRLRAKLRKRDHNKTRRPVRVLGNPRNRFESKDARRRSA